MAMFRKVHTEFWTDPKVLEEMTPEDKYFMLYLLTNPSTTQIGIYSISKKTIGFELGYSLESVNALMDRFINKYRLIKYNNETRELAIKNWGKYNLDRGGKPMEDCVKSELSKVKDTSLIDYVGKLAKSPNLKALYDTWTIRGQEEEEEEEEEKEQEEEQEAPKPKKAPRKKYGEYKNILLTEAQHAKLIKDYSVSQVEEVIKKMDEWIQLKGKPYKDFNLALRKWIREESTKGAVSGQVTGYDFSDELI